jgi:2-succinyl-5-enolpyruvyl-6-hydroxy-3-cyclohexene-1-carboxylate synthase
VKAQNPSHALALVLVDELARNGVTDAVLSPGSRSTALAMALHDDPRVRLHVHVDERSGAYVALGIALATGQPVAVVTTSGGATVNLHPAVVEADTAGVPLLLLTADRPPEMLGTGANQTIDQHGIYGSAPRWEVDLGVPEDRPGVVAHWRSVVCRAVAEARGGPRAPGPVHLNLPFREPTVPAVDDGRTAVDGPFSQELAGRPGRAPWTEVARELVRVDDATVDRLAERIAGTERGLVLLGSRHDEPFRADLARLVAGTGWPVVAEPTSSLRGGDRQVTAAHHLLGVPAWAAAHVPDLVLRIGRTGLSRNVEQHLGATVPQVLVEPYGRWHDPRRALTELVVADPADLVARLADRLPAPASSAWLDDWMAAEATARSAVDAALDAIDAPTEPRTARDVAAAAPAASVLVVASSMPVRDLDLTMHPRDDLRVLANRGASGIDGTVSTASGVALGGGAPVTLLIGDLALLHDGNGFLLSPDAERLDLVTVVVDNDGGGIFHLLPQAAYPGSFERVFGTPHGRDLGHLARLHDLAYAPVERAADVPGLVTDAHAAGGRHLIHVRTDRVENAELHRRLQRVVAEALR